MAVYINSKRSDLLTSYMVSSHLDLVSLLIEIFSSVKPAAPDANSFHISVSVCQLQTLRMSLKSLKSSHFIYCKCTLYDIIPNIVCRLFWSGMNQLTNFMSVRTQQVLCLVRMQQFFVCQSSQCSGA